MTAQLDQLTTAYDPFGEPMEMSRACADAKISGKFGSYGETRRAAIVFWALALLFVGGRIYLSEQTPSHGAVAEATSMTLPGTALR
ncbi:hypothetical protein AFCDBAGC_0881 [Methylobacterium cerastii]|uniref:Uncharacterized protein n=1 Tax=Methylobacterium cerastii TaxID=932741 RepID=A0ABQ4QEA1_9HYPH|nr:MULTISPECIES: hypothetical protein [Methylobacterium]TXN08128.1 hypothetical protein FV219_07705 [Methylobacterium sp. WL122]TXM67109.1 hypothetical protein FV226_22440 [Methylobacterium sp. WL12]TXM69258.1 hypothetical protein FV229_05615 [Methylobacterium sp. WL120]TXN00463.1 hypothetical protein FV222_11805 [Methylobacterium sp. WL103]TXN80501.1 hypothetical protein FV234_16695 [Methylobacterium sp. WL8]